MSQTIGGGAASQLPEGLYELLKTDMIAAQLEAAQDLHASFEQVDEDMAPDILSRHVAEVVRRALAKAAPAERVEIANTFLGHLDQSAIIAAGPQELHALHRPESLRRRSVKRPTTRLSESALLTNSKDGPNLAAEIRTEMDSANSVDLLCAFVRWTGLRLLQPALERLQERGVRLRVITTTYMGATERRAIDELVNRYGAEVKISYETQATRLHAKAWLFRRDTGFDTAYVGSSNLSKAALLDGLEWNVRLSNIATPALLKKFEVTFDSYWEQRAFQNYDPERDGDKLDAALERNGGKRTSSPDGITGLEVQPYLHQEEMLEALEAERLKGHSRNLLVAATGTGKTVIAALDYRRLSEAAGRNLSLLFVAHRQEILRQSMRTYRNVMQDGAFGELFVGDNKPKEWRQVFASVQSLNARGIEQLQPDMFDVVVIDEFHHAMAPTYRSLIDHLEPQQLLGLTATPERGDGTNVADQFFDGRTASELRLWDALDAGFLVPFHYFGVSDDVDLSQIEWRRGNYDLSQLDRLYTGNDARSAKVIRELRDKVTGTDHMRALGFCVSVQHAQYMAEVFNRAGIASVAIHGGNNDDERARTLTQLRDRQINCIFTVDLFNEGLDLPEIDTILLLRPTQSATIFLQQLGRGLRRAEDKSVLTVLDFIGQQRREFRLDNQFFALTGVKGKHLEKAIEDEFPFLPSGSQIVLDRVAARVVLENIRIQLKLNRRALAREIASYGELELARYLDASKRDVSTIYRARSDSWTNYLREAGLIEGISRGEATISEGTKELKQEDSLLAQISGLRHVDDPERAGVYTLLASENAPTYEELSPREQTFARMLYFSLWPTGGSFSSYEQGLRHLRRFGWVCDELRQLIAYSTKRSRYAAKAIGNGLDHIPLRTHASYGRYEVLAALGAKSLDSGSGRTRLSTGGVDWCPATSTDVLFVTLNKDEKDHSPRTMYKDYAISPVLFHWESQNATRSTSPTGKRYLDRRRHQSHVLLLTRDTAKDENGQAKPYMCLGQVDYVQHSGERPIAITWMLHRAMPADVFATASAVAQ